MMHSIQLCVKRLEMESETLLNEIEAVFPHVPRPKDLEVSFHKVDCFECEYIRKDLEKYREPILPDEAIRLLYNDLSCLSSKGWLWVFPSYLRHCITKKNDYDDIETEFLIYALSPDLKYQKETLERLSGFSKPQLLCLLSFLEWCERHEHWSDYCADEIENGIGFLKSLLSNKYGV
ncbi:DUF6714 family protein [Motiliproteus sp. MSK22-1]|uniref:DUF6714 family protein n=1 Tax=Motiliproteus sp. MSK22-1 TaxID=1897630 RepID=UPI0018E92D14|nr:DUF6714 family protein [Motiliproteus sp. MSK22-1]